ncbi:MAG: tRNA (adenosine(37)-N6)-threonylcarbamoyltransferase complex dimerization subunit type 1 TsaB [Armatimonadetes bacterium]|nr:tRNA (adenosine(37)-N6)-threonylcarbamoyltransferase complex dimerization subunit type 1 TsaB [Armatimonadota bacterium]
MRLLAIETSGFLCGAALVEEGQVIRASSFLHRMHLSERLLDEIDRLLRVAELNKSDIDGIAVDVGPGSFTGLRIGVMTAKTLAFALKVPVVGILSFDALIQGISLAPGAKIFCSIRAKRGWVYFQQYRVDGAEITPAGEAKLARDEEALTALLQAGNPMMSNRKTDFTMGPIVLLGNGWPPLGELRGQHEMDMLVQWEGGEPPVEKLAMAAVRRFEEGRTDNLHALRPNYIAPPVT